MYPSQPAFPTLSRRDTTYYGLFGNVTEEEAEMVKNLMDPILTMGNQSVVMSLLFAILSVAFFMTVRYLLQDGMRRRSNKWMLAALAVMYVTAAVSYAFELLALREYVRQTTYTFSGRYGTSDDTLTTITDAGQYILQDINILCGDLIIIWRTSVVWHNSVIIRRLNLLFLVLIILGWIAGIALLVVFGVQYWFLPLALSLAVNLWSTAVIGFKTWHRRRLLRRQIFMAGRASVAIEGALAVLTETGLAYTALWVIYVAIVASFFYGPATYAQITLDRGFQWTVIVMGMLIPLYPTLLILLIARHKTPLTETLTSIDVDVSFAVPTHSTSGIAEDFELYAVPNSDDKVGNGYRTEDSTGASQAMRGSTRLEPNR
ncbi:hypothetical protein PENSPDRAFT_685109 [Peniophora sp. CONT]|nr:hypothetical protein PENSPDRAFT_685109 [Peniophora sp. CONT]